MTLDQVDSVAADGGLPLVIGAQQALSVPEDIQRLCAEVLKRPVGKVKMHRSFVALGGDSLLAVKLMSRCRASGYNLKIHDVLRATSLRELCETVELIGPVAGPAPPQPPLAGQKDNGHVVYGANGTDEHATSRLPSSLTISPQAADQLKHVTLDPLHDVDDVFPCSPAQEMFLFAQAIHPETYQCTVVLEIHHSAAHVPLDFTRLQAAWDHLVYRHASLRTVFISSLERPGHFDQVVLKKPVVSLDLVDSQQCTADEFSRRQPITFPVSQPTHRVAIYKHNDCAARLRLDVSHALVDGESFYAILRDFAQAYARQEVDAAAMPYRTFVSYQDQLPRQHAISYWSEYLSNAEPSWFPVKGEGNGRTDLRAKRLRLDLDFASFCAKSNVTIANVCQVAWALVLRSYTTLEDVCFSYVSSGRHAPLQGIEGAVGAFVDTMMCRVRLDKTGGTLAQALAKAKHDNLQGLAHPTVLAMGEQSEAQRFARLRGNTLLSCQRKAVAEATLGSGLDVRLIDALNPSEYDFSVGIQTGQDELDISIDYWASRTDEETVAGVADSFARALQRIISQEAELRELDVVPPTHLAQLREWNSTIPPRVETRIQDRVYEQRLLRPDAVAVQGWDGDLTYRELDDEANKLAAHLASLGVRPETKVPLCFEKSKWALIAQLATLKAGGCVVPLGIKQPKQRTEIILRDLGARLILTSAQLATRFAGPLDRVLVVDEHFMSSLHASEAPPCSATTDTSAFIIYTSGSTGVPKGVVLTHGSLGTSLHYLAAKFGLGPTTRMVQFSAYTFDISIQDIYTTWQSGGCLCVISEDDRITNLGAALRSYGVNCAGLTSTVAGFLAPEEVPTLKTLVLLGEAVKSAVVARWLGHAAVFNAYGPSECSIQSSCRQLVPECNALNIGYALAGALWVVDANDYNRLVPIGAPGELLIEGPLLAREYLNDPVKTAAAFVFDPTWVSRHGFGTGRRMYRTGDLVYQNPDGSILYIGRRDTQIKVRGQRVEVGEIEHHALQHEAVADVAVVFPRQGCLRDRLVGFLTLHEFCIPAAGKADVIPVSTDKLPYARRVASKVSEYLATLVSEHMIPNVWIPLSSKMPQNESGKLDRKALGLWVEALETSLFEQLTASGGDQEENPSLTATPLEHRLQQIWSAALKVPESQIPVHSRSFLSSGGDSITAMQVVSLCTAQGISVAVRDVLQSQSVAQLALKAGVRRGQLTDNNAPDAPFPLSPAQRWLAATSGAELRCDSEYRHNHNVCLSVRHPLERQNLRHAIDDLVTKHPMLRARFHRDSTKGFSQSIHPAGRKDSYLFDAREVENRDQAYALISKAQGALHLERGPVFSALLITVGPGSQMEQLLFMNAHKLVADHASWRIILSDLDNLLSNGATAETEPPVQFPEWINSQADGKKTQPAMSELAVAPAPADLEYWGLTLEHNLHGDAVTEECHLDEAVSSLLLGEANRALRTEPVEIIQAALLHSFCQTFLDRASPTLFEEVNGRDSADGASTVSGIVGQFAKMMPINVPAASSDEDTLSLLRRTKDLRREIQRRLPQSGLEEPVRTSGGTVEVLLRHVDADRHLEQGNNHFALEQLSVQGTSPVGHLVRRQAVFVVEVSVAHGQLCINLEYNRRTQHLDMVRRWIQGLPQSLRNLATELSAAPSAFTSSDFPLVGLDQEGLEKLHREVVPAAGLRADDIDDIYPCSAMQQGILMTQAKSSGAYQIQQTFAIRSSEGSVSVERVARAWQVVVDRHPMLRTVFVPSIAGAENHLFDQVVLKSHKADVDFVACEDDDELERKLGSETDLTLGGHGKPSHKLRLVSAPSGRVYVTLATSHALVDASSLSLLQTELARAYDGTLTSASTGPSYSAFVAYLQQTSANEALRFWRERLSGVQPCYLPALTESGFPEPAAPEAPARRSPFQMVMAEVGDMQEIRDLAGALGVTVATVFQLAWALVLSQYTDSADVCFGYLTSGRDVPVDRAAELVGPLINIMVSRLQVDPEMKLEQALRVGQADFLDGYQHQRASLLEVSHALRLEGQSLFNTCLSYRHAMPPAQEEGGSIAFETVAAEDPTEYDVTVNVLVSGGAVSVALQYLPTFVSAGGATRLLAGFLHAVRSMAKQPDSSLSQLQVLTQDDESRLCEWNCRVAESDIPDCIPDLVRRQRIVRPDAVAVCAWDGEMTYAELEDAADRLAHHLATELAVGPEVMVPLCFNKSRWAVVAQLAVLKAGGVVVSINSKHPAERLRGILTDLGAQVMLATAEEDILARFQDLIPNVLGVDSGLLSRLPERAGPVCRSLRPENAAFVIYTSGSTGVPKGVVLTHGSLRSSFEAHGRVYGMGPGTRSLQFAAYTFDASISDIWGTLSHGGCVCVISEDERMNELQHAVSEYRANLAQLTPTVAGLLNPSDSTTLKTLVLGGEAVKLAMIEHILKTGSIKVLNGYGPSECSIYTTCSQPLSLKSQPSNIGRALVGGVWVVSTIHDTICPVGGVGELWIEGPLLARGYHHDKTKTDASFVVNPPWAARLPQLQGRRFYRTGDIVKQNATGEVLYIGRKDTQVKIRGQRVEIGEIEHRVKKVLPPSLRTVAVTLVLPGGNANNPMLAIAVQGDGSVHPEELPLDNAADNLTVEALLPMSQDLRETFTQLHASLLDALPSYMVPRLLFPFTRLPFTSSGKLNRRLLRVVLEGLPEDLMFQYSLSSSAGKISPPRTATETSLQTLWATCLGMEPNQVGIRDHFLHAGGDSFTAMRLVAKANAVGLRLTVGDVFRYPVLADMAHFLDELQGGGARQVSRQGSSEGETQGQRDGEEDLPRFAFWEDVMDPKNQELSKSSLTEELHRVAGHCGVGADDIEDVLPCTPVQEALMAATAQRPDAYVSRWVYRMPHGVDCQRFRQAWSRVAQAAPILRTRIVPGRLCGAVQVIVRGELSWFSGGDLDRYMADEEERHVAYGTALFRHAMIESPEGERHFVLTAHHSGYDGWSLTQLLDAVTRAYDGREITSMPPFSRFARFLAQQDQGVAQCFWQAQFKGDDGTPFPASPRPSYRPNPSQVITLELKAQPVRGSITLTTLLRAAWALVVRAHTRQSVAFAEVRAGRAAPVQGIFDMAGPVITTVPVRIQVDNTQRVAQFLAAVQQQATDMLAFEHTGLRRIRRFVGRDLGIGHLFAVQPAKGRDSLTTSASFLGFEMISEPLGGADDYGLSLECLTGADGDEGGVQVSARFDEAMIPRSLLRRLLGRFKYVFSQLAGIAQSGGILEHAQALVGDVKMLSPDEVAQVAQWNSVVPERRDALVYELVGRPASAHPGAPAICSWDGSLSHGELDRLAEQLAHHLASVGVGAEVMVPLCFDKSKWAIVSILAVLKAGGAVVPISAEPMQRAQTIIRDVQAKVVLMSPRFVARFQGAAAHILPVDDALFADFPLSPTPIEPAITSSNAAFVIYTSGSTGVPKGVVLEHGSMSTSMQAHGARFGMNPGTRAFQFASFTFDISLHDMLTTLQFGGCVCMPSEEERVNDMAGAMRRMAVNYSFLPPRVLPTVQPSEIPDLQTLIVGGESLHAGHIEPWLSNQRRVFNAYGPAECCIITTCNELVDPTLAPNIGHALAGGLWVVDESDPGRLVPIGVVGELLIEGPLLARGYLNDPKKTSDEFIVDPEWLAQYGLQPAAGVPRAAAGLRRMYRTGDLVRQNDDGSLTYVGRRDSQVKVRGQRVEIGEVEHHLKQQTAVTDAIVLYPANGPAKSRLVAILTLRDFEDESNLELLPLTADRGPAVRSCVSQARDQLHSSLPPYMIPDVWIPLASMPQNNSNKADRKRLVQWLEHMDADYLENITSAGDVDVPATPTSDIDRQIQAVVGEVLHLSTDAVAMNRSFLSLGGDSISAMQIVSLSRTRHGLSVAVQDVLQRKSLSDLSRSIAASTSRSTQAADADYVPFSLAPTQQLLLEHSALQEDLKFQAGITDLADLEDLFPVSSVQQGIIMSQIKGQATYRVQQICEVRPLDPTATVDLDKLARSWEAVVSRHAILRTVFIQASSASSQFYQAVLKRWKPDVRNIHCQQASQVVSAFAREQESLDAQDGKPEPPHRLTLCTTDAGGTYAQLDISHALTDASSLSIMFRDAMLAYDGVLPDSPTPSYATYISFMQRTPVRESLAYWTHHLSDAQPCFLPRSALPSPATRRWKTTACRLDDLSLLRAFRDAHGVTMANLVQLAWAVVLAGYTGSADAIYGYLASGRDAPISGASEIAGPMINMMVSRIQLGRPELRGKTVAQIAQQVQHNALEAFNNQRASLSEIQHALHLSDQGLFNTTVSYYRPSAGQPAAGSPASPSLTAENIGLEDPTEYDANVSILAGEQSMDISLQYSTSFLDDVSASHLLDSLRHALLSIAANPESLMEDLDVLGPSDVRLLRRWNSHVPPAIPGHVHDQIHQQSVLRPDAPAVCGWDGELTYSDLDGLADRLACHLTALGVVEESMVGLCFEKSTWAIVAMLAVAKAGGVAVPLGVQLPPQRLRLIFDDSCPVVILTSQHCAPKFDGLGAATTPATITVHADFFRELPDVSEPPNQPHLSAESAAVVIYTSGSTGLPKGVVLTHGALYTSLDRHGAKLGFGTDTRTLQFSAYVFDISLLDVLGTLRYGGCVCVVSEEDRMDIANLAHAMERMGVNLAVLTPTVASLIHPETVPTLRTLGLAGEAVPSGVVETWSRHVGVFNCYGPAECTVLSTIQGPMTDMDQSYNIGTPLAGLVWVTDQHDHNRLAPIGGVGELLIEGPLLARGYLNDPEKTTAAFVTDPGFIIRHGLEQEAQAGPRRMYRTGDLVRQSPVDGSLVYVGRKDGMVKLRGQRLEVGEIEYWTKRIFAQAQTVAVELVRPTARHGEPILAVALELQREDPLSRDGHPAGTAGAATPFLALTDSLHFSLADLQLALAEALPPYMVPSLFVPVWEIPLTASGKLDRKRLRASLASLSEAQLVQYALAGTASLQRALTETEARLRELWSAALNSSPEQIGPRSHFFRLGGDSVTAMRLVALSRGAEPAMPLSVVDVFKNPVLESLAKRAEEIMAVRSAEGEAAAATETDAAPFSLLPSAPEQDDAIQLLAAQCNVAPDAIEDAYPSTPLQEGLLAVTARRESAYVSHWVFRVGEQVDFSRLEAAWRLVAELAPILRTRILAGRESGTGVQVVVRGPIDWVSVTSDLAAYLANQAAEPMGFGTRLARFANVTTSSERFFVWTIHHSIYDGWTARKLLEAVGAAYRADTVPSFAPYTRFIRYLQRTNSTADAEKYWRSQLQGDLGAGFPTPAPGYWPRPSSTVTRRIGNAGVTKDSAFTTATLLRAAWALVVSQETGGQEVLFAAPVSGRTAPVPGVLEMAGPTLATVPVRIGVDLDRTAADHLAAVQEQAVGMMPIEHTGLQHIIQMLPDKTLPLNHLFVVQPFADRLDQAHASSPLPGLELVPAQEAAGFHNFPLIVECNVGDENGSGSSSVELEMRFDETVLPSDTVQSMLDRFEVAFAQLQTAATSRGPDTDPDGDGVGGTLLCELQSKMMSSGDIALISKWNTWGREALPERNETCVHHLVRRQRIARPEAQAIHAWDGDLSYAQLGTFSLRLARHLASLGVGPEIPVCAMFDKSRWAIVAQLATLEAGGAVVPVNHKHPNQRIKDIINIAGTKVILTSSQHADRCREFVPHVVVVDEHLLTTALADDDGAACEAVRPTNPAFIIFTSGSTGVPKGVILEHHALATSLLAEAALFSTPATRTLQFSAFTFDISIAEVFMTLAVGGCVCVVSEDDRVNNLAAAMQAARVDTAYLTPTVLSLLQPQQVPTLGTLIIIGEALKPEIIAPWVGGNMRLFNAYGPAECCILSTCSRQITDPSQAPNIGSAIANSNLWVVDPSNFHRLVPVGVAGELLIEGPLLARGYLGDEEKTAAAFVADPAWLGHFAFAARGGRRYYRTGDMVRQSRDGSLVYLGRKDDQAKIHGQRMELGEVELWVTKQLLLARGGRKVVAVAGLINAATKPVLAVALELESWSDEPAETAPLGMATQQARPDPARPPPLSLLPLSDARRRLFDELRHSLSGVLPAYMVPAMYFPVANLPLTDSGKLDRKQIWKGIQQTELWTSYSLAAGGSKDAPSTDTERQLQQLWARVLKTSATDIGTRDDFFRAGGDSIAAMRLVAAARETEQTPLTVADVFQHPVLSDLARFVDAKKARTPAALVPIKEYQPFSSLRTDEPLEHVQSSLASLILGAEATVVDAAPVTDFQALSVISTLRKSRDLLAYVSLDGEGSCDVARWSESCRELIRHHEILRTAYIFYNGELVQAVLREYEPEIPIFETGSMTMDEFTAELTSRDMDRPPRLGRPFVEFAILANPSRHRILLRISHAEYDNISLSYFVEHLRSIHGGEEVAVPGQHDHPGFTRYMSTLGTGQGVEDARRHWRTLLQGSTMPRIRPAPQRLSRLIAHGTRTVRLPNPNQQAPSSPAESRSNAVTAATLVRAAWALVLARHTSRTDVVFGDIVSGRNTGDPVAARAAGCCVNIVPVRAVLDPAAPANELLRALQQQQIERLPHETLGFREYLAMCPDDQALSSSSSSSPAFFFSSRVNHLDRAPEFALRIGERAYRATIALPEGAQDPSDVTVTSLAHPADGRIDVTLGYAEGAMGARQAEALLAGLCAAMELFARPAARDMALGALLELVDSAGVGSSRSKEEEGEKREEEIEGGEHVSSGYVTPDPAGGLRHAPAYRGDVVGAGCLAFSLQKELGEVDVDDVLEGRVPPSALKMVAEVAEVGKAIR
ncbi:amino acid adenylation [Parathielavia hyrcaniae]|uniref:Amino acid adenylation n=1 Tax=Parathielavia hyrcaniae TaxID=113614 RepID=A0AAN6Q8Z6_9PEZI|nr:amino acid adenylation [Parathielavia hyrcaniae]